MVGVDLVLVSIDCFRFRFLLCFFCHFGVVDYGREKHAWSLEEMVVVWRGLIAWSRIDL